MKKRALMFTLALLGTVSGGTAYPESEIIDMVVASVDQEAILYSEIVMSIQPELQRIQQTAASQSDYNDKVGALVEATLEEAIENKILYREAQKFSIQVPDENVEGQISQAREAFNSEGEFIAWLQDSGETLTDFRERLRKRIMAQSVEVAKMNALEDEIVVDEAEVVQFYEENKERYERPERVRVRQIMLSARRNTEQREKALARLDMVREELQAGAEFADLARAYSQGSAAADGGLIGWTSRGDLLPELEEAAFGLAEGEISQVVESQFGVHLIFAEKREDAGLATLDEVRASIEPQLKSRAALEKYELWFRDLRQRSKVRIFL